MPYYFLKLGSITESKAYKTKWKFKSFTKWKIFSRSSFYRTELSQVSSTRRDVDAHNDDVDDVRKCRRWLIRRWEKNDGFRYFNFFCLLLHFFQKHLFHNRRKLARTGNTDFRCFFVTIQKRPNILPLNGRSRSMLTRQDVKRSTFLILSRSFCLV